MTESKHPMLNTLFSVSDEQAITLVRNLFFGLSGITLLLMALGSTTRVMNAGLACPDWPLCFGTLVPHQSMTLQVFLEWFHRLVASSVGLFVIALNGLIWTWRRQLPQWLPWAGLACLGLVILQGVLGGLTVTQLLRFDVVTAHLATGLLFFSCLLIIGTALLPYRGTGVAKYLNWVSPIASVCVYGQCILGAVVASRWAVPQCLASAQLCRILYSHLAGVAPAVISVALVVFLAWRTAALHPWLRQLSLLAALLLILQIGLGIATLTLHLQVVALTVAHQTIGASLLGTLVLFSGIAVRDRVQAVALATLSHQGGSAGQWEPTLMP